MTLEEATKAIQSKIKALEKTVSEQIKDAQNVSFEDIPYQEKVRKRNALYDIAIRTEHIIEGLKLALRVLEQVK